RGRRGRHGRVYGECGPQDHRGYRLDAPEGPQERADGHPATEARGAGAEARLPGPGAPARPFRNRWRAPPRRERRGDHHARQLRRTGHHERCRRGCPRCRARFAGRDCEASPGDAGLLSHSNAVTPTEIETATRIGNSPDQSIRAVAMCVIELPVDYSTARLSCVPGRKTGLLRARMVISSPVCGLRPCRAARSTTLNDPNPLMVTSSPFDSDSSIAEKTALTALLLADSL